MEIKIYNLYYIFIQMDFIFCYSLEFFILLKAIFQTPLTFLNYPDYNKK
jgi:hypothetical protein